MAAGPDTLVRYIRRLVSRPESDGTTDGALLNRFIAEKDETAFTTLVDRHGPLVFHVCRRVLGDVHEAEDAFQATFLILARKAASVRPREALPAWLHVVARRVALKARSTKTRQIGATRPVAIPPLDPQPDPLADLSVRELLGILDEELERLPKAYRLPVILCCLEGRSLEEAARQLGWTRGSVKGRLERGRARLQQRLIRRGLTLSAALAAAEVSRGAASAAGIARLVLVRAATAFAAGQTAAAPGVSAKATALAGETLRGMGLAKLKMGVALLLSTCVLAISFGAYRAAQSPSPVLPQGSRIEDRGSKIETPRRDSLSSILDPRSHRNRFAAPRDEDDALIEVTGRVLDPDGVPIAGARLYVGYSVRRQVPAGRFGPMVLPPRTTSGTDGRFRFAFARSELDATWLDHSWPAVIAVADGYGPDWTDIRESATGTELSLKLVKDFPVDGRILNNDGKPVAAAKILVWQVESYSEEAITRFLRGEAAVSAGNAWRSPLPEQPSSVTTDDDGRFRLTGLGRDRLVALTLDGPGIEHTFVTAIVRPLTAPTGWKGATFEVKAMPSQSIRGVVRDKVTRRPVAGVRMCASTRHPPTFTDAAGRFEIQGCPKLSHGYALMAQPQAGQPYFAAKVSVPDRPGYDPLTTDLDLVSGIPLSGCVTDQATGKPPRAARVEYYPLFPNGHSSQLAYCPAMAPSSAVVRPDGSFSLVVLPGPGVVCVAASPCNSYAEAVVEEKQLVDFFHDGLNHGENQCLSIDWGTGARGALRVNQYHALSLIHPDEKTGSLALDFTLQRGRTLRGVILGPDGKPLTGVEVVGLTATPDGETLACSSFTVLGLSERGRRELVFRHREKGLGKFLTIRGDETGPLTVQLEPYGSVLGRLVDKEGKPVPGVYLVFYRSGQSLDFNAETDREGRFRGSLLPRQKYRFWSSSSRRLLKEVGELEVESGQTKDLGDMTVGD